MQTAERADKSILVPVIGIMLHLLDSSPDIFGIF